MISVSEAQKTILTRAKKNRQVEVNLREAASFFLAENILSDRDIPPFNRVTMDGFAVKCSDFTDGQARLKLIGTFAAGDSAKVRLKKGEALAIMTGSPLPEGADSVVKVENSSTDKDWVILKETSIKPGLNVARCGEDAKKGITLLGAGTKITPSTAALCASVGKTTVKVHGKPKIKILSTGSEIVEAEQVPLFHQIRDCNSYALQAYCKNLGVNAEVLGITRDEKEKLAEMIKAGLQSDILLLSGGVSMGEYDFVPKVLKEFGITEVFHKAKIRPGKPVWFGEGSEGNFVFGLPGNPVSVQVNFKIFVEPLIRKISGSPTSAPSYLKVPLKNKIEKPNDLEYFLPAKLVEEDNQTFAQTISYHGSGDYFSVALSQGLVRFPGGLNQIHANEIVDFLPWDSYL